MSEVLETVNKLTRERGLTTICVLHDLNAMARFADQVVLMCKGRLIACGSPREILTASTIAEAFEIEARITRHIDGLPTITPLRPVRHGGPYEGRGLAGRTRICRQNRVVTVLRLRRLPQRLQPFLECHERHRRDRFAKPVDRHNAREYPYCNLRAPMCLTVRSERITDATSSGWEARK
jgi:hypothetical protein